MTIKTIELGNITIPTRQEKSSETVRPNSNIGQTSQPLFQKIISTNGLGICVVCQPQMLEFITKLDWHIIANTLLRAGLLQKFN